MCALAIRVIQCFAILKLNLCRNKHAQEIVRLRNECDRSIANIKAAHTVTTADLERRLALTEGAEEDISLAGSRQGSPAKRALNEEWWRDDDETASPLQKRMQHKLRKVRMQCGRQLGPNACLPIPLKSYCLPQPLSFCSWLMSKSWSCCDRRIFMPRTWLQPKSSMLWNWPALLRSTLRTWTRCRQHMSRR
jgi:hypothetical protein